ncbi:MAG: hypothetical protein AUI14_04510 [Actinobacteria bacterium 13_2_20CM_2_71_6]|nr:MAG: hypothetical protein AUI14_04510 [Actinobacteria bacterium 13_2_20CM_2_71_6]
MNAGQIVPCRWCQYPIGLDGRMPPSWVHLNGRGYSCRDAGNVLLGTAAEPAPQPEPARRPGTPWPLNPERTA